MFGYIPYFTFHYFWGTIIKYSIQIEVGKLTTFNMRHKLLSFREDKRAGNDKQECHALIGIYVSKC